MQINKINNQPNFKSIYIHKRVSPAVKQALLESPVIQQIGRNYNMDIFQYERRLHENWGKYFDYGLKFRLREIVPNLFHKNVTYRGEKIINMAFDPNITHSPKVMHEMMDKDIIETVELLTFDDFKGVLKKVR